MQHSYRQLLAISDWYYHFSLFICFGIYARIQFQTEWKCKFLQCLQNIFSQSFASSTISLTMQQCIVFALPLSWQLCRCALMNAEIKFRPKLMRTGISHFTFTEKIRIFNKFLHLLRIHYTKAAKHYDW